MIGAQLKTVASKAVADRIFAMNKIGWESHAQEWVSQKGWKVRIDPGDSGSSVLEQDPLTGIEVIIRPYYDNAIDPPEALFVEIHYPTGKAPKFTAELKRDLEYEVRRNLGPDYSVSAAHATSHSFVEIELIIKKAGTG
jgi:hypothetical protein